MNFFEIVLAFLIGLHAFFMIIDEFYFHMKRILPKWERIGHPLDTLFFLACFVVVIFFSMTKMSIIFYIILSCISCVFIIKDEFIHLKHCSKYEQMLHALMFILHPVLLIILFLSWSSFTKPYFDFLQIIHSPIIKNIIWFQFSSAIVFLFYQVIYWNYLFKDKEHVSKGSN
jgi:hypothetical protein